MEKIAEIKLAIIRELEEALIDNDITLDEFTQGCQDIQEF